MIRRTAVVLGLAAAASLAAPIPGSWTGGPATGAGVLQAQQAPALRKPTLYEDLQMFSQVLNQIRTNHLDSVDVHALVMAAVEGMIREADPHSFVLPVARLSPEKLVQLEEGKLFPLPLVFRFVGETPIIAGVAPESKAARSDILPGDEIVAVDGEPVRATTAEELMIALAGPRNTVVRLRLARQRVDGSLLEVEREVRREQVDEETAVPVAFLTDSITGYIRISAFSNLKVDDDLNDAIGRLRRQGMRRLILDLRDNGGGIVDEAAGVASAFLPKDAVLYITEQRKGEKPDTVRVKRSRNLLEDRLPLIVLINEGSASASELLAGALQDHDRALLVGRTSFGKSLLMRGFPLMDGSLIMMAFGRVKTPCGRVVQREYRGISRRDYYRLAGAARDTAGRPSCTTAGGRVVYGGGGIWPDVVLAEPEPAPLWLARIMEEELPLKWAGGYLSQAALPPADTLIARPVLPAEALADFRAFAAARALAVPEGVPEAELARLERALLRQLAYARGGEGAYHRMSAALDPVVREAAGQFARAGELLGR